MPGSLVSAEEQLVTRSLDLLDAQTAAWLYTASSNSSVQYITLQALSDFPLRVARNVKDRIGEQALEVALKRVVQSTEFLAPERQGAFDRSLRTLLRLFPMTQLSPSDIRPELRGSNSLSLLLDMNNPDLAVNVIVAEILRPDLVQYDAVIWAHILTNAFEAGADWLESDLEHSKVWKSFVSWFLGSHACSLCPYKSNTDCGLYSLNSYGGQDIIVMNNANTSISPDKPMCLMSAATHFMAPSLCDLILFIAYPSFERFDDVPSDVQLHLALIRTEWMLKTSRPSGSSMVSGLIDDISSHVGIGQPDDAHTHHKGVQKATFHALKSVLADTFETDMLSLHDRQRLVHPFFRCLAGDDALMPGYQNWITDSIADRIIEAVFMGPRPLSETFPLLVDLLLSAVRSECQILLPKACTHLCGNEWLASMASILFGEDDLSVRPEVQQSYAFLAAAFVDALHILNHFGHPVYKDVRQYAQKPPHLLCLCKMLLLSNANSTREKLWRLVPLVDPSLWTSCLRDLDSFISNECRRLAYKVTTPPHPSPNLNGTSLAYDSRREELPKLLSRFATHVLKHELECDCRIETATEPPQSSTRTNAWWGQYLEDHPDLKTSDAQWYYNDPSRPDKHTLERWRRLFPKRPRHPGSCMWIVLPNEILEVTDGQFQAIVAASYAGALDDCLDMQKIFCCDDFLGNIARRITTQISKETSWLSTIIAQAKPLTSLTEKSVTDCLQQYNTDNTQLCKFQYEHEEETRYFVVRLQPRLEEALNRKGLSWMTYEDFNPP
ncbi:hypothetical protein BDZ89DRAFT_1133423 [Hymenopellis radicata]|nr:hypothetical protein BDZ89DRAFT_1133423 [Hymenopellis radicata]